MSHKHQRVCLQLLHYGQKEGEGQEDEYLYLTNERWRRLWDERKEKSGICGEEAWGMGNKRRERLGQRRFLLSIKLRQSVQGEIEWSVPVCVSKCLCLSVSLPGYNPLKRMNVCVWSEKGCLCIFVWEDGRGKQTGLKRRGWISPLFCSCSFFILHSGPQWASSTSKSKHRWLLGRKGYCKLTLLSRFLCSKSFFILIILALLEIVAIPSYTVYIYIYTVGKISIWTPADFATCKEMCDL